MAAISQMSLTFKRIFLNENIWIPNEFSLTFVSKGPNNNIPGLFHIMAWCRPGDKPSSEPMLFSLPPHICVTRPQCINVTNGVYKRRFIITLLWTSRRTWGIFNGYRLQLFGDVSICKSVWCSECLSHMRWIWTFVTTCSCISNEVNTYSHNHHAACIQPHTLHEISFRDLT